MSHSVKQTDTAECGLWVPKQIHDFNVVLCLDSETVNTPKVLQCQYLGQIIVQKILI